MADGHLNKCKNCVKSRVSKHRSKNLESAREYDRKRGKTPKRLAQNRRIAEAYRNRYPKRYKAKNAVNNAIRDGRLTRKPCEVCGAIKAFGHHDDYNFPLQVRWPCQPCHKQWHSKNQAVD